jgi:hypothetical protein
MWWTTLALGLAAASPAPGPFPADGPLSRPAATAADPHPLPPTARPPTWGLRDEMLDRLTVPLGRAGRPGWRPFGIGALGDAPRID